MGYVPKAALIAAAQAGMPANNSGVQAAAGNDAYIDGGPAGAGSAGNVQVGSASHGVVFYNLLGFFGTTPTTRQTGGQNVTNSVTDSGSTNGTVPNWTDLSTYANDATAIRRALYQIARMLKQDHDALRAYGLLT